MFSLAKKLACLAVLLLVSHTAHAAPAKLPRTLPLDAMIGQMIMVGFKGTGEEPLSHDITLLLEDIRAGKIGGVIYFEYDWQTKVRGRNVRTAEQVKGLSRLLQQNAPVPLLIAVDQEGGRVQRLRLEHGFFNTPSAAEMGKKTPEATYETAYTLGSALRRLGINVNFSPVTDVAINPDSPAVGRIGRSFSQDPATVTAHATAFAKGLAAARVASSYKHFPGHGSATDDSHESLPDVTKTWRQDELMPYRPGVIPSGIPLMVMPGHLFNRNLDDTYPASISRKIITGVLRDKLKWNGVVVTDDLEMNALALHYTQEERILLAVNAGVDIILFGNNIRYTPEQGRITYDLLRGLVQQGKISPARIKQSWERIRKLKQQVL